MTNDALVEEINGAYRQLSAATEALARADRSLAEHVRRIRLDKRRGDPCFNGDSAFIQGRGYR